MSAPQFTPGPWAAIKGVEASDEMRCGVSAMRGDVGYLVATIENGAPGDICDTEYANARLIAAAPQLFEALDTLLNCLDREAVARLGIEQETLAAVCAIAKVRGEQVPA